ncbi:tyrosine-type recombinase/integrase [Ulvibacterium sp.]|uniref:tyrosine-type recombinase/integrase n=1 Tax=Ulvibacterium sp. TaxID=2665914 RepID=UPI003BAC1A48
MYLNYFLTHCKTEKKLSEKTIEAYASDLKQFKKYIEEEFDIHDFSLIRREHIKKHLIHINKYAPRTVKRKIATLKVFYSHLLYEDYITENPFDKLRINIRVQKSLPSVLSIKEVTSILKQLQSQKSTASKSSMRYTQIVRNIAIVELLFATGIRVSELCYLKRSNIHSDFSTIKILGKGNKERIIPITNEETINALKDYHRLFEKKINQNSFFFINRLNHGISEQSVRHLIKKISLESGIKRGVTPHVFRHTFATQLLEANINIRYIQELLGHSSIRITEIYTHVSHQRTSEILKLKHPRNLISYN